MPEHVGAGGDGGVGGAAGRAGAGGALRRPDGAGDGAVLYAKGETERRPPASVTKVMTLLARGGGRGLRALDLDEKVRASANAASMGGSQIWLEEGEELSVAELIKCVAVVSANDCAVALAERIAGSEAAFVERMNERAAELGLENTRFTNCTASSTTRATTAAPWTSRG